MAIRKLIIEEFIKLSAGQLILDVRSPGEFIHAHIPEAYSLPLFTDEERKVVGTYYKQRSREDAIKTGLDFFGGKMKGMIEEVEKLLAARKEEKSRSGIKQHVFVHCWRGGMRSAGVAWLLDLYGFDVYTLAGGYKAFRSWVLRSFEENYDFSVLGGYTGSGKTDILSELKKKGQNVIDLEALANHRGSAFGAMGSQPTQEMFENLLAHELYQQKLKSEPFWIEDESQRIGQLNIPNSFFKMMRTKPVFFVDIPFAERLNYITSGYGSTNKEKLVNSIIRIQKRLGPLETKTAIGYLVENNYKECFDILLQYYDKLYTKGLNNRENVEKLLTKIDCMHVDAITNAQKLLACCIAQY